VVLRREAFRLYRRQVLGRKYDEIADDESKETGEYVDPDTVRTSVRRWSRVLGVARRRSATRDPRVHLSAHDPPKTARSRRQVTLTQTALAALRRHRTRQIEERMAVGTAWQDRGLVFCDQLGGPLDGTSLTAAFRTLLARVGLPPLRFHDLRHTAATLMLGRGVHPKIASEMLGHATVAITLDLYSHVTPTMQQAAAAELDAVLAGK
jgi:integrase